MLYAALFLSALHLGVVFVVLRRGKPGLVLSTFALAMASLFAGALLVGSLPVVVLQAWLVFAIAVGCHFLRGRPYLFVALSLLGVCGAYAYVTSSAWEKHLQYRQLREEYPLRSMAERVREPQPSSAPHAEATLARLDRVEGRLGSPPYGYRARALMLLHERTIDSFINSPGFGVSRFVHPQHPESLRPEPAGPPIAQPEFPQSAAPTSEASLGPVQRDPSGELATAHEAGLADFANPEDYGYVKDRHQVAGFLPHRLRELPSLGARWRVRSVELVSLLRHEEPAVYLSPHLPRMDELADAPTRPLDVFETASLAALRKGDDLIVREGTASLRMLGSLRSASQCVKCHGGKRGDLLGAFSYQAVKEP